MKIYEWIIIVYLVMSVIGFALMGIDKLKATKGKWRIKEATLFFFAIFGGGIGATLGMYVFRHKTKHWYFKLFFPLFAILQTVLLIWTVLM